MYPWTRKSPLNFGSNPCPESGFGVHIWIFSSADVFSCCYYHCSLSLCSALSSNYRIMASVTIVDAPGFRNPVHCGRSSGATFEDLCHNYVQERLQLLFHETVFTSKQDLYAQVCGFFALCVLEGVLSSADILQDTRTIISTVLCRTVHTCMSGVNPVSYTHLRAHGDGLLSRMPSSA